MTNLEVESKSFEEKLAEKLGIIDPVTTAWIKRKAKLDTGYEDLRALCKTIRETVCDSDCKNAFLETALESLDCLEIKLENFYYEEVLGEVDNEIA